MSQSVPQPVSTAPALPPPQPGPAAPQPAATGAKRNAEAARIGAEQRAANEASSPKSKQSNRSWAESVKDQISVVSETADSDSSDEPAVSKPTAEVNRGPDGKFLPATPKEAPAPAATEPIAAEAAEPVAPPKPAMEPPAVAEKPKEEPAAKPRFTEAELVAEVTKTQNAWTQIHREAAKLRQREEGLKAIRAEYERLQGLEKRLKSDERYKVIEEVGGSLGDWQTRAVAGEGPNPQIDDLKKMIADRDAQWENRINKIIGERDSERQSIQIRTAEQNFDSALVSEAAKYEHTRAMGPRAVDGAHDFAEYVARALSGRSDIPRGEFAHVKEYLEKVPRAVALDTGQIMSYHNSRLAQDAALWAPAPKLVEPPRAAPPAESDPHRAETRTSRGSQPLDNSASSARATPPTPREMTKAEFASWASKQIRTLNEDELG